ncbi:nucleolar transcription factor 1-A-like [Agrilus planipennis]|uniref:Nucleolar transcription factor 1-A-like n=1 Tax=Agrilus planipennis TaxID=224129 RepID=A0A1W4WHU6_AGRPL|nr:nucleolar transcription factor 1-A-like [Agrilus planipennis]
MGIQNKDFIDLPFKLEYTDDDEEIVYFSGDETEGRFSPYHIWAVQPNEMIETDEYDFEDDEDDDEYNPADDEDLSDSDIQYDSEDSQEQAYFSDSNSEDTELAETSDIEQGTGKETEENKILVTRSTQAPNTQSTTTAGAESDSCSDSY